MFTKKQITTLIIIALQVSLIFLMRALRPNNLPFEYEPAKILGNPNAKINLIVFSEILCPYCIRAHKTLVKILEKYPDELKVTYKHYLLRGNKPYNLSGTMAMECAADQGKFWQYYEILTANIGTWYENPEHRVLMKAYAEGIGLNMEKFSACFDQNEKLGVIQANHNEGKAYLVQGTPTGYLNGDRLILNFSYEYLDSLIKSEIKRRK